MKSQQEISVGLDVGTTKIVVFIGRKDENKKIEILGIGKAKSTGVRTGVVNNISQTVESIKTAINEAERYSGIKIKNVMVGIAGQHIRSMQYSDYITRNDYNEVITKKNIDKLIHQVQNLNMSPGEEIIHVLPQEYKIDNQEEIKEPIGMYGNRIEANFHLVIGQISSIRNIGRCVKSSGLNLSGITLEPLASAESILNVEEKEAGVVLVDIGGGTTDVAIFKDNIIRHTAVIPVGGNVITRDIKENCSIIERQAEQLKIKFGSAWPGENKDNEIVSIKGIRGRTSKEVSLKELSYIINMRISNILEKVYLEIKNYGHDKKKRKLIAGMVITGGGAQLRHIKPLSEYITGMDVRIGYPNEFLSHNKQYNELAQPEYSTVIGLVIKGFNNNYSFNKKSKNDKIVHTKTLNQKFDSIKKKTKSFIDIWADRFKQILDDE